MTIRLLLALIFVCALAPAQRRVDSRNLYERVLAVVPMVGSGTPADPIPTRIRAPSVGDFRNRHSGLARRDR